MLSLIQNNRKVWLKAKNCSSLKIPSRNLPPVCGPPRHPMTMTEQIVVCGGSILLMMVIPVWGLLSLPTWSLKHQNRGKANRDQ